MPNIKSAKKRALQTVKRHDRNVARKSDVKTAIKKLLSAVENKELDDKFTSTELEEVKTQLSKEEFKTKKMQEDFDNKEKEYFEKFESFERKLEEFRKQKN